MIGKKPKFKKPFEPVYFFGYGSLLWPPGINGRGMRKLYHESDLTPARLHGYRRSFSGYFQGRRFYGLMPDPKATVNGIIFPIKNRDDYRALLANEGALKSFREYQVYWTTRVTASMEYLAPFSLPAGWRVMALICHKEATLGQISPWYVSRCYDFASKWGEAFLQEFLKTGGWSMTDWNRYRDLEKAREIRKSFTS